MKLKGKRIICLYGKDEKGSLCPQLDTSMARVVAFSGGHHFGGNYQALADSIFINLKDEVKHQEK
jgi:type IV secretory pathway VirJ component